MVFLLVIARSLVRNHRLAVLTTAVVCLVLVGSNNPRDVPGDFMMITFALVLMMMLGVMVRYGLLTLAATAVVHGLATTVAPTHDWSAWHAQPAIPPTVVLAAIAAFAYRAATAGRGLIPAAGRRP